MARMYEMNLMIRLQDRASARMRRIAGDMNALSRHAQAQNKLQTLRNASLKKEAEIKKSFVTLNDITNKQSETYNKNISKRAAAESRFFRAQHTALIRTNELERKHWATLDAAGRANSKYTAGQKSALLGLESAQANLNAETTRQVAARRAINAEITREIKLLNKINAEIIARAPLEAAGAAAAKRHQQGRALTHGGSLAFMGGAVAVGAAGLAAGSFAQFNVQAAKAATQVTNTNLRIGESIRQTRQITGELETRLLGLSKQFPATSDEMAKSLYTIFSSMDLGATAAERMKNGIAVLTEANKAAVGGQVDLATATDTLITVFNDFDPQLSNLNKNMAELFSIVRFMRGGFEELNAGMNKLAPAAKQAKQSLIEVGTAFAVVTQAIPSAAQSSTAVARLLDLFGSKEFIAGMKRAGEDITTATGQLKPLSEILGHIVNLDPKLQLGGPKLTQLVKELTQFGSDTGKGGTKGLIQMQRALTVLITDHVKHLRILKQAKEDTVEYEKSVKILSETADVKWKTAMNNLRVAWIQFGKAAMPVLLELLEAFSGALNAFNGLSGGTRKWIGVMTVAIGVLVTFGGLLASAFGGVMMVVATRRLWAVEKALKAIAIANGQVAATSVGAKGGILAMGKNALKAAGWVGVAILAFDSLKGVFNEFNGQNVQGNGAQKMMRGWFSQFKSASQSFSGMFGVDTASMFDSFMKKMPILFGKATKKNKKHVEDLTTTQQESDKLVIKNTKSKLDAIIKMNAAASESDKKIAAWKKKLAKAEISARQTALQQQKQDIDSAVKNLMTKYQELQSANDAAIGNILSGPISGGPVLSAFNSINNTLMGIGVKPIKVPLQFIMQDAQAQLGNFNLWRGALQKLSKRLPAEMVQELRGAGIEKLPEILSLADAGPEFIKEYAKVWKDTKSARDAATKADMDSTLKMWNGYGKDVAWQIVNGLISSGAEAKIYEGFTKTITTTFAGQLKTSMDKAVDSAVADWVEANPKPKATPRPTQKALDQAKADVERATGTGAFAPPPRNPVHQRQWWLEPVMGGRGGKGVGGGGGGAWATGGIIPGRGMGDTVPAMLTPGEVVLNRGQIANASRMLGTANNPHALFSKVQGFNKGGVVAAENYIKMKGVSFQQDPKTGAISVINGKGVRYRQFKKDQAGWSELNRAALGRPGGMTLKQEAIGLLKSFTPSGIKDQITTAIDQFKHPIRTLKSGGNMSYPGGKPGKSLRDKIRDAENIKPVVIDKLSDVQAGKSTTPLTKAEKAKLRQPTPGGMFADPGAATTPAQLAARKAALERKKAELGVKSRFKKEYDAIGIKQLTPEELAALEERMRNTEAYKGPANQMPDHSKSRASADAAARRLLEKRKATAASNNKQGIEKYASIRDQSIQSVISDARGILDRFDPFMENWHSTYYSGYPEVAADFAGSYLYHTKAANKRIAESVKTAKTQQARIARLIADTGPTGPMPQGKKKPAKPIPDTRGVMKAMRDAKARKREARVSGVNLSGAGSTRPRVTAGTLTGEAKRAREIKKAQNALLSRGMGKQAHDMYVKYKDNPEQLMATYEAMLLSVGVSKKRLPAILGRIVNEERGTLGLTTGRGQDVDSLFRLDRNMPSSLRDNVTSAFNAINTVHGVDSNFLDSFPVEKMPILNDPNTRARILQMSDDRGNFMKLVKMQIGSTKEMAPWFSNKPGQEQLSALHEIGHVLDVTQFGSSKGFGSEMGKTGDLLAAIRMTSPAQILRNRAIAAGASYEQLKTYYPLLEKELFARAYAQWIAKRQTTRNWEITDAMESAINHPPRKWPAQWPHDEFGPVAKEFDRLFRSKGLLRFAKGGWVPGMGNSDKVPAFLTPGEYVVSKPMIKDLTSRARGTTGSSVTHETNLNIDVTNPTGKAILDALKPVLFSLRNQP